MNTAYAQQASPPHPNMHINSRLPASNEGSYRAGAQAGAQYHMPPHPMSMSQAPVNTTYDPYNQLPASRAPMPELGHSSDGHPPLAPGAQPPVPEPASKSVIENGRKYELLVVQQPRRARMCGFGDKDRRPITPPPCVRLVITDVSTGKEVDCNEVDHGMFVLNVDLWDEKGQNEVNLVRHAAGSPSISATAAATYAGADATHVSYNSIMPQPNVIKFESGPAPAYNQYPAPPGANTYAQPQQYAPQYNGHPGYPLPNGSQYPPQSGYSQQPPQQPYYPVTSGAAIHAGISADYPQSQYGARPSYSQPENPHQQSRAPGNNSTPQGMFTRNLIGSLAASAFRLTDPKERIGIWFVLQDLSVRTEGNFRLHFSFVNVGVPTTSNTSANANPNGAIPMTTVNTSKAPVLAACFSDVFTVYSAKRFPGVVESTELSKCFATQGIKIPIRKDGVGKGDKDKDADEEHFD